MLIIRELTWSDPASPRIGAKQSMPETDYINGVFLAFEGEVYGEALFRGLAAHEPAAEINAVWSRIAAMEHATQERLLPVASRHKADLDSLVLRGRTRASEDLTAMRSQTWREIVEFFAPRSPAALSRYEALRQAAPEPERAAIDQLLAHGQAFAKCMAHLRATRFDQALAVIDAYLERT